MVSNQICKINIVNSIIILHTVHTSILCNDDLYFNEGQWYDPQ